MTKKTSTKKQEKEQSKQATLFVNSKKVEDPIKYRKIVEIKSRRTVLLLKQSVFNKIKAYGVKYNRSVNDLCNEVLEAWTNNINL